MKVLAALTSWWRRRRALNGGTRSFLVIAALFALVAFLPSDHLIAQESRERPLLHVEPFTETNSSRGRRHESVIPQGAIARSGRYVFVRSLSTLVAAEDIENKLRKHPDFQRLGMTITRQETDADLILEVRRSVLTKFVFTAIAPESMILIASGKLSSLGGTVDGKVAKLFMKQIVAARGEK